jgi:uncharacterized OsmC-like protein
MPLFAAGEPVMFSCEVRRHMDEDAKAVAVGNSGLAGKRAEEPGQFSLSIDSIQDYEFRVKFADAPYGGLSMDEPPPVGHNKGPNPSRLLATAVGGCMSASLLFSARKLRLNVQGLHADVKVSHTRNEKGRLRIGKIEVEIAPTIEDPDEHKMQRCLEMFEDFCIVTQSVRNGIDVSVKVKL